MFGSRPGRERRREERKCLDCSENTAPVVWLDKASLKWGPDLGLTATLLSKTWKCVVFFPHFSVATYRTLGSKSLKVDFFEGGSPSMTAESACLRCDWLNSTKKHPAVTNWSRLIQNRYLNKYLNKY